MTRPVELLQQGRKDELWQMCCGFIDLNMTQFMTIQKRLLLEEIRLLKSCELGRKVMRGAMPETVEKFREQVPLTTYADYCPELLQRREDVLPARVARWIRAPGKPGEYDIKWMPVSEHFAEECERVCGGFTLFAFCRSRGDVSQIKEHLKVLYTMGGAKYASGILGHLAQQTFNFDFLPFNGERLSFTRRRESGFTEALYRGLDGFGGIPSVLVAVGEQIKQQSEEINIRPLLSHPQALLRLGRALVKSKLAHRPLLPKDLWPVKAIVGSGTDSAIFKKRVEELWGRYPLEIYAGTEGGIYATQTWDYEGMSFVPNLNFFEFIPEEEHFKWQLDHSYQPKTVLLDEVKAGENYEIVITNFHGGPLARFRIGDMVRITSLRNEKLNIDIPQMVFYGRADDIIDVTGLGRLTERIIWEAIDNTGIPYVDWMARKEVMEDRAILHLYLEIEDHYPVSEEAIAAALGGELKKLNKRYRYNPYSLINNFESLVGLKPIEVTLLPHRAFANCLLWQQIEETGLEYVKLPHVNPPDKVFPLLRAEKAREAVPAVEAEAILVQ